MPKVNAQPFPFTFEMDSTALIVIDMQRDFIESGGFGESLGNDVSPLQNIVPNVKNVLQLWRGLGGVVIHTRESHLPDLSDCPPSKLDRGNPTIRIGDSGPMGRLLIRGEFGTNIVPELSPIGNEIVIDKPGKGAFYNTDLMKIMQELKIKSLIFSGVTTEVCVQSSMREANDRGFNCLLLNDCCASYFPSFHQSTIDMIIAQGAIVGWVASSDKLFESLDKV